MSHSFWPTLAALSLLPLAIAAQPKVQAADPADARAPAPALNYRSPFKTYLPLATHEQSPDKIWIAANREVQANSDLPKAPVGAGESKHEHAASAADAAPGPQEHSKGH